MFGDLFAGAKDVAVTAGEAHSGCAAVVERGDEGLVHAAAENHKGGVAGFGIGDAQAGDELRGFAHLLAQAGELDATAVHQGDAMAVFGEVGDGAGAAPEERGVFQRGASEFYDKFHGCSSVSVGRGECRSLRCAAG